MKNPSNSNDDKSWTTVSSADGISEQIEKEDGEHDGVG